MDRIDIMVCPVRAGAGVSIKVAESLYHRIPVLATTLALCGLECPAGSGLVVRDEAKEGVNFLNSPEADLLAVQSASEELRSQFVSDHHREKWSRFLSDLTH